MTVDRAELGNDFTGETWERIFRASVESAYNAVLITDADLDTPGPRILYVNPAYCRMTGYSLDEILGHNPRFMQGPRTDREVLDRLRECCAAGRTFEGHTFNYRKDGTEFEIEWTVSPVFGDDGRIRQFLAVQRDVTEREAMIHRLEQLARQDVLTGLHNRQHTQKLVEEEIERARRHDLPLAIALLDVDHFKAVNDEHGHSVGDEVLQRLARLISARVRVNDIAGRWGGEEFLIALPHTDLRGATEFASDLRARIARLEDSGLPPITVSVGVAPCTAGDSVDTLFDAADRALYEAKDRGRDCVMQAPVSNA